MFFRRREEKERYSESTEVEKKPQSVNRYRIIGHSVGYGSGEYRSFITYVDEGILINAEVSSNTTVELGVQTMIGSYVEIIKYESELDTEMRICVEYS